MPIATPDRYVRGRVRREVSLLSVHGDLLGSANKNSQSDLFTFSEWEEELELWPERSDIYKKKKKCIQERELMAERESVLRCNNPPCCVLQFERKTSQTA